MFRYTFSYSGLVVSAVAASTALGQMPRDFSIVRLPTFGGNTTTAFGINERGWITGSSALKRDVSHHPYAYAVLRMHDLGIPSGVGYAEGLSINIHGQTVGYGNLSEAILWEPDGSTLLLNAWGTDWSSAEDINDFGEIVGEAREPASGERRAVLWRNGDMINLGVLPGTSGYQSIANSINNSSEIVGWSRSDDGDSAFYWTDGVMEELSWVSYCIANDINDLGEVVGGGGIDGGSLSGVIIWADGIGRSVPTREDDFSGFAKAINNLGQIIGVVDQQSGGGGPSVPVVWPSPDVIYRTVESILPPNHRWVRISTAEDINDASQVVGFGRYEGDGPYPDSHAFIISPVYPTITLDRPRPGIAGEINTIRAGGVEPGTRVYFIVGRYGGGYYIPGCDLQENSLQIEDAKIAGSAIADAEGIATLTGVIPLNASGRELLFQAVVPDSCKVSNLVVAEFE